MKSTTFFIVLVLVINSLFAQNNAHFVSQTVPSSVNAGESFDVSIVMENTGTTTWSSDDLYRLGSQAPGDNFNWGTNRIEIPNDVAPNEQVTITATLTAPTNHNPVDFQWKMVQDGAEWFGDQTQLVSIEIPGAIVDDAQFISQNIPSDIVAGQQFDVEITYKNIGGSTWSEDELIRLGSKSPDNNSIWGTNRIFLTGSVEPNENVTFTATLTAPTTPGFYNFQWQVEREGLGWFGDLTENVQVVIQNSGSDTLLSEGKHFAVNSHVVSTSFFCWYGPGEWQLHGPWIPAEGRAAWDGSIEYWKKMIKQTMYANIDVLYVELIPAVEQSRGNLFIALKELRQDGWEVPKVCPFLDPLITYSHLGQNGDCSTEAGKDELVGHYIRFFEQYYLANTDEFADDFVYTQDGHPVLDIWHIYVQISDPDPRWLGIENYSQLTRSDVTNRLSAAFGADHSIFNNDIRMIANAISAAQFPFVDERVHQFEVHEYFITKEHTKNGVSTTSAQVKPGYWDQNVRSPGHLLSRDGGANYTSAWNNVNADASINRVYIESFNEYDEGSGIFKARPDTIYKRDDSDFHNTGNDVWSNTNDPYQYIKTTAAGAAQFNDDEQLNAKILWDNIPTTMDPNETFLATVLVRNTGNEQWNAVNDFMFGEMETIDETLFGPTRCLIDDTEDEIPEYGGIFRGRVKTFNIEITAPSTSGTYTAHWRMLQEGVAWFGDTLVKEITVSGSTGINQLYSKINLYPNPANDYIIVKGLEVGNNLILLDITGKRIAEFDVEDSEIKIQIEDLDKGVYFINSGIYQVKFIKE